MLRTVRVRTVYNVRLSSARVPFSGIALPLTVETADGHATLEQNGGGGHADYTLTFEYLVDPGGLRLVEETGRSQMLDDGTQETIPAVEVASTENPAALPGGLIDALTFLTDVSLDMSRDAWQSDQLLPDSPADAELLARVGTSDVYARLSGFPTIRTFSARVDSEAIMALLPKAPGLRLYADALRLAHPVAQFRELWRVLESAFRRKHRRLVDILALYPPARQIGFTREEVEALLVLRGRASHAESRAGLAELREVERQVQTHVPRLKSLVERVLMTKEPWGTPTVEFRDLLPPSSWVGPDSSIVIVQNPDRPGA